MSGTPWTESLPFISDYGIMYSFQAELDVASSNSGIIAELSRAYVKEFKLWLTLKCLIENKDSS